MLRDTAGEWLLPNMLRLPRFSTPPSLRDTSPIFCIAKHPAMLRGTAREVENSSGLLHSRYFNRQKRNKKERVHRNDVPSLYRASAFQAEGREFEPRLPLHYAAACDANASVERKGVCVARLFCGMNFKTLGQFLTIL